GPDGPNGRLWSGVGAPRSRHGPLSRPWPRNARAWSPRWSAPTTSARVMPQQQRPNASGSWPRSPGSPVSATVWPESSTSSATMPRSRCRSPGRRPRRDCRSYNRNAIVPWSVPNGPRPRASVHVRAPTRTPTTRSDEHRSVPRGPIPRMETVRDLGTTGNTGPMDLGSSRDEGPKRVEVAERPRHRVDLKALCGVEPGTPWAWATAVRAAVAMIVSFSLVASLVDPRLATLAALGSMSVLYERNTPYAYRSAALALVGLGFVAAVTFGSLSSAFSPWAAVFAI